MKPENQPGQKSASLNTDFLLKMLLGSAAVGGGTGAIVNLLRQRRALLEDEADEADDELAVPVFSKQANANEVQPAGMSFGQVMDDAVASGGASLLSLPGALVNKMVGDPARPAPQADPHRKLGLLDYSLGGLAVPVGFLGGLGLTRALYNKWRRQDLRLQLQEEQEQMRKLLEIEARRSKHASVGGLTTGDMMAMAMLGFIPLTAVTSGLLTHAYLDQMVPPVKTAPTRRLRLQQISGSQTPKKEGEDEFPTAEQPKYASAMLIHAASQTGGDSGLHGLLGATLKGALPDIEGMLTKSASATLEDVLEFSDLYADHWAQEGSDWKKVAAVSGLSQSALGPAARMLAGLEFQASFPSSIDRALQSGCSVKRASAYSDAAWRLMSWAHVRTLEPELVKSAAAITQDIASDYSAEHKDEQQEQWRDAIDQLMSGAGVFRNMKVPKPTFVAGARV